MTAQLFFGVLGVMAAPIIALLGVAYWRGQVDEGRRGSARLEVERRRADRAEEMLKEPMKNATREVAVAFDQARKVMEEARLAMAESRGFMKEAVAITKRASEIIIADMPSSPPPPTSVGESDRQVMRDRKAAGHATKP